MFKVKPCSSDCAFLLHVWETTVAWNEWLMNGYPLFTASHLFWFFISFPSHFFGASSEGAAQVMTLSLMLPTRSIIKTTRHFPLGEEAITEACLAQTCESGFIRLCLCVSQQEVKKKPHTHTNCDRIGNICKSGEPQKLKEAWVNGTLIFLAPLLSRGWCLWISSWICIPQIMRCASERLSFISPEKGHWPSVAGDHLTRGQIKSLHFPSWLSFILKKRLLVHRITCAKTRDWGKFNMLSTCI